MKPIIGVVSKYIEETEGRQEALVRDEIKNAILDNGGIVIGLLPTETELNFTEGDSWKEYLTKEQKEDLIQQISLCDGIIIQGGRDSLKYESWIAEYCYKNDIPTLGICAGQNAFVRAFGGTTKKVENEEKHNQYDVENVHNIFVKKGTRFYDIVKCEKMMVNSRHKRVIDKLPKEYIVSAKCDDGYFDVIEAEDKRFFIALRFHPESLYKKYKEHNQIFKEFIDAIINKKTNI